MDTLSNIECEVAIRLENPLEMCVICQETMTRKDYSLVKPCNHEFCYGCIMQWSKIQLKCPLCKRDMNTVAYFTRMVFNQNRSESDDEGNDSDESDDNDEIEGIEEIEEIAGNEEISDAVREFIEEANQMSANSRVPDTVREFIETAYELIANTRVPDDVREFIEVAYQRIVLSRGRLINIINRDQNQVQISHRTSSRVEELVREIEANIESVEAIIETVESHVQQFIDAAHQRMTNRANA